MCLRERYVMGNFREFVERERGVVFRGMWRSRCLRGIYIYRERERERVVCVGGGGCVIRVREYGGFERERDGYYGGKR